MMQLVDTGVFEALESNVRSYCRSYPDVFTSAKGELMYTVTGRAFLDFFAGAGALNYGHNNDFMKKHLIAYLEEDGIAHGLDMYTTAKEAFLQTFHQRVLRPKGLNYKVQFCGPTGTNAVEAALKLARRFKKRAGIFAFTGGFHGMSLGSLATTANQYHREAAGVELNQVHFMPYPTDFAFDTIAYMDQMLSDGHSGVAKPASVLLETVQAEGGINIAPIEWLLRLRALCDKHDILMIVDDIQVGCGRAGGFFSFERAGIVPDMVVLSKSISGYGLPMSLLLLKPELDIWKPAEHNGTFRGNQLAFVGATAALQFRDDVQLEVAVQQKEQLVTEFLHEQIKPLHDDLQVRGIGLIHGVDLGAVGDQPALLAKQVTTRCYELGLVIERVGRGDTVIKIMPPLTIRQDLLERGLNILRQALEEVLNETRY